MKNMKLKKKRFILNLVAFGIALIAIVIAFMYGKYAGSNSNGTYEFGEFAPPDQTWVYTVKIKNESAELTVNGFETDLDIKAHTVQNGGGYNIVFDSYGDHRTPSLYGPGDVLLSLYPAEAGMSVEWRKMQPNLNENKEGKVFTKMK
jgi:hypothetical protein